MRKRRHGGPGPEPPGSALRPGGPLSAATALRQDAHAAAAARGAHNRLRRRRPIPLPECTEQQRIQPRREPPGSPGKLPGSTYVAKHGRHAPVLAPYPSARYVNVSRLRPLWRELLLSVPTVEFPTRPLWALWKPVSPPGTLCFPLSFTSGPRWWISLARPGLAPFALCFGTVTSCQLFAAVTTHIKLDRHGSEPPWKNA